MSLIDDLKELETLKAAIKNNTEQVNVALDPYKITFLQSIKDEFKTYFESKGFSVQLNGKKGKALFGDAKVILYVPESIDIFWGVHSRIDISLESIIKKDFLIAVEGELAKGGITTENISHKSSEIETLKKLIANYTAENTKLVNLLQEINNNGFVFYLRALEKKKTKKDPYEKLKGKKYNQLTPFLQEVFE